MCLPRNCFWPNEEELTDEVEERARKRRKFDEDKETIFDVRPDAGYRGKATMVYAMNAKTGCVSVGYSGGAGGMSGHGGKIINTDQSTRRIRRLDTLGLGPFENGTLNLKRPRCNCAEAAAVSIALSWGEDPSDLIIFPFFRGKAVPLCENCQTWVPIICLGYYCSDNQGKWQIKCRDPDCGGGGGRSGGGSGSSNGQLVTVM